MDATDYIATAIPAFFVLIAAELLVLRHRGLLHYYRFADSVTNLACGIGQQVTGIFIKGAIIAVYAACASLRGDLLPAGSAWTWLVAFVGVDLGYYWWHRASHRINLLWAAHVVHHQSEEFNLSVALRQAWFTSVTSLPFYLPLALLGVPPLVFATTLAFSTLYQFWIHTRLLPRLGAFGWLFNEPSHHRVHHACNGKYLDRNYGATLIVWDRLFGTFMDEEEEPAYGTVKPFRSWNPIWANFEHFGRLVRQSRAAPHIAQKLSLWLRPPGWCPQRGRTPEPPVISRDTQRLFAPPVPRSRIGYVVLHFTAVAAAVTWLLLLADRSTVASTVVAVAVLASTLVWGGLFEDRRWALPAELLRLTAIAATAILAAVATGHGALLAALATALAVASGVWLLRHERYRSRGAAANVGA